MRYNFERKNMDNKLSIMGICLCFLGISACVNDRSYLEEECQNGVCTSDARFTDNCTETPDGYSVCSDSDQEFVNYTKTQADFRKYGERTPRDQRISQSGAGNNMTATVRPSIDDEVVDYEEKVMDRSSDEGAPVRNAEYIRSAGTQDFAQPNNAEGGNSYTQPAPNGMSPAQNGMSPAQRAAENLNPNPNPVPAYNDSNDTAATKQVASAEEQDKNKDWLAEEGQSLKELLTTWSEESGWRLIWKTNRNYTLNAGAMFRGNFADVSSALVRAFARARPAPVATFYKGNRVLVIETMEDENAFD